MNRQVSIHEAVQELAGSWDILHQPTCHRCGGLMVSEDCMDLLDDMGVIDFSARRCVQCGELLDPVILRNRARRIDPMKKRRYQPAPTAVPTLVTAA